MTHCPRCRSIQSFAAKREKRRPDGQIEIYIGCNMCRWKQILYVGTPDQIAIRKDIDTLRGKVLRGDPLGSVLNQRQKRLSES